MQKMHRMQLLHLLKRRKAFSTFFLHIFQLFFFIFQFFCWYSWFIYAGWCRDAAPASLERCIAHMRMPAFFGCSPASDAARHRMPLLVNAKPKKVPASSYVRCQDAAPLSKRSYSDNHASAAAADQLIAHVRPCDLPRKGKIEKCLKQNNIFIHQNYEWINWDNWFIRIFDRW